MKCRNCRAEIDDEAMFCPECGAKVERHFDEDKTTPLFDTAPDKKEAPVPQFCPNCGTRAEAGAEFCEKCGQRLKAGPIPTSGPAQPGPAKSGPAKSGPAQPGPAQAPGGGKKLKLPLILGCVAAAVVILAVGIFAVPKVVGAIAGRGRSGLPEEVFYIKDRGMYGASLKSARKKPVEYTDRFADAGSIYDSMYYFYDSSFVSKDGKYHFIMEDVSYDTNMTFTLYSQKGSKDPVKIDSDIQDSYSVTDDNKVVYIKNDNLYVHDLKEKKKLDSEVSWFTVDKEGKNIFWAVYSGVESDSDMDKYDMYCQKLDMKEDKTKLISDADLLQSSEDLNTILMQKEDAVYLSRNQGAAEKLIDGVENVWSLDLTKGTFFYTAAVQGTVSAMDFVDDDMAASDAQVTEPVRANYERTEVVGQGYWAYTRTVIDDRYYDDQARYEEKMKRDELRRELGATEVESPYRSLYCYSGGEAKLITDRFADYKMFPYITEETREINNDYNVYMVYIQANDSLENRVKLSELSGADEVENMLYVVFENDATYCLYADGRNMELDLGGKNIGAWSMDIKNNQVYCLLTEKDDYSGIGDLVSFPLAGDKMGEIEDRDSDVEGIELVSDGNVYYMKDVNDQYVGDLYCNGERVAADVSSYTTESVPDSTNITCIADADSNSDGSLLLLKGREAEKIADNVSEYYAFGENCIVMLTDYNYNRYKGELKYYNGKETRKIDSDVRTFFN